MPTAPFLAPDRDDTAKRGHQRGSTPTVYFTIPGWHITAVGTFQPGLDTDHYQPIFTDEPLIVDRIALEVSTAGTAASTLRFGLYRADKDFQPTGAPLTDSGTIAADSIAVKTFTPTTPLYLRRGRYLGVYNHNAATAPILRTYTGGFAPVGIPQAMGAGSVNFRWSGARAYAAFPTPGTLWASASQSTAAVSWIVLRVTGT